MESDPLFNIILFGDIQDYVEAPRSFIVVSKCFDEIDLDTR